MTIAAGAIKIEEAGNGVKTGFDFTFQIYENTDILVYKIVNATGVKTLQTLGVDYTVSISTTGPGGTVTYAAAPTALQNSFIILALPLTQAASLVTNGKFRDGQIEDMLDKLTLLTKQLDEEIGRCLKVASHEDDPAVLPTFGATTGYLYWNGTSFELATP